MALVCIYRKFADSTYAARLLGLRPCDGPREEYEAMIFKVVIETAVILVDVGLFFFGACLSLILRDVWRGSITPHFRPWMVFEPAIVAAMVVMHTAPIVCCFSIFASYAARHDGGLVIANFPRLSIPIE